MDDSRKVAARQPGRAPGADKVVGAPRTGASSHRELAAHHQRRGAFYHALYALLSQSLDEASFEAARGHLMSALEDPAFVVGRLNGDLTLAQYRADRASLLAHPALTQCAEPSDETRQEVFAAFTLEDQADVRLEIRLLSLSAYALGRAIGARQLAQAAVLAERTARFVAEHVLECARVFAARLDAETFPLYARLAAILVSQLEDDAANDAFPAPDRAGETARTT
jgi:hypothetical protein